MYKFKLRSKIEKYVLIDDEDKELVLQHKWHFINDCKSGHAFSKIDGKTVYLHRLIMNPPKDKEVDHINRNGLDNRKKNLRVVTHRQNMMNLSMFKNNKSGFTGVQWNKYASRWKAVINVNKISYHLGYFDTVLEARWARIEAEQKIKQIVR